MTTKLSLLAIVESQKCYGQCKRITSLTSQLHIHRRNHRKPRNARSKRALEKREPKEVESAKTAIFVRGTHTGERLNHVMKDLVCNLLPMPTKASLTHTTLKITDSDGTQTSKRHLILQKEYDSSIRRCLFTGVLERKERCAVIYRWAEYEEEA